MSKRSMAAHLNAFTASFSAHLMLMAALVWLSAQTIRQKAVPDTAPAVAAGPRLELPETPRPLASTLAEERIDIPNESGSTTLDIPYFKFDFEKIASRAASLFPFLTDGLSLDPIRQVAARASRGGLPNPYAQVRDSSALPPLQMSGGAMQTLVDKLFSRRERWSVFQPILSLTERHSPSSGQLPALIRRYGEQNLLQPYVESHLRDPRLWTMLHISADHTDFIRFITGYTTAHPSTPAATELLFMLDELVQGSRDTLLALLEIGRDNDLWWTRTRNRDAYDLVLILQSHYRTKLEQRA